MLFLAVEVRVNSLQTLLPLKNTAAIIIPCLKKTDLVDPGGSTNTALFIRPTEGQGLIQGHILDQDQGQGHLQGTTLKKEITELRLHQTGILMDRVSTIHLQ